MYIAYIGLRVWVGLM